MVTGGIMQELFEYIFDTPDVRKLKGELKDSILFQGLSQKELDRVLSYAQLRSFKKGDHVFFEGDPGSAIYIILKGNIDIVKQNATKRVVLTQLSKGMFFGELALVHEIPRTATACVEEESLLLCLFKHDLDQIVKHYPRLANKVFVILSKILAQRLLDMNKRALEKAK